MQVVYGGTDFIIQRKVWINVPKNELNVVRTFKQEKIIEQARFGIRKLKIIEKKPNIYTFLQVS